MFVKQRFHRFIEICATYTPVANYTLAIAPPYDGSTFVSTAAFLQDEIKLSDRTLVTLGARYSRFALDASVDQVKTRNTPGAVERLNVDCRPTVEAKAGNANLACPRPPG